MPLPREGSAWLPREWAPAFDRYALNEAIWLNDTEKLRGILAGGSINTDDGRRMAEQRKRDGILVDLMRRWGWARIEKLGEKRTDLPIPLGANIADLSAAQLMSEAPRFRLVELDTATGRRKTTKGDTQNRLDTIANSDDAHMTLLEGAQLTAAIGGAVLKAAWDLTDPDRESVWFDVVGADCALPEFNSSGRLVGVSLWQEYPGRGDKVYRHLERHAAGTIEHALYLGTRTSIGKLVRLDKVDELGDLLRTPGADTTDNVVTIPTGLTRITAQFWRNRPTRGWRRSGVMANLGRSDFELCEPAIDAYSEAWGSAMRDIRLGKARLLVPLGMLERAGTTVGSGGTFDPDRELYTEVGGLNPEAGTNTIKEYQALIRWEEHLRILAALKLEVLDAAGWSLSSYGNPSGVDGGAGGVTATEVTDRTTKSERTRDEKALLFKQPANPFIRMLMELDAALYPGRGGRADLPELAIDFPDVSQIDPEKQARTFMDLSTAHAISIEQTVRERHTNWDDDDIDREVARIWADMERLTGNLTDPTTIELSPGPADPNSPDMPQLDQPSDPSATDPGAVPAGNA